MYDDAPSFGRRCLLCVCLSLAYGDRYIRCVFPLACSLEDRRQHLLSWLRAFLPGKTKRVYALHAKLRFESFIFITQLFQIISVDLSLIVNERLSTNLNLHFDDVINTRPTDLVFMNNLYLRLYLLW